MINKPTRLSSHPSSLHRSISRVSVLGTLLTLLPLSGSAMPKEALAASAREKEPIATYDDDVDKPKVELQKAEKIELSAQDPVKKIPQRPPNATTRSLPTGENKTGVGSQAISAPKGPGTIEGMGESFSAQASTGIATFSVPFALLAARGDAQPSIGLSYSSASGSGVAGVGWSVDVPYIARQTDRGLPSYKDDSNWHAGQDRFVYNGGQELVPVAVMAGEQLPAWAVSGWQYFRPRVEGSYLRFFWNPAQRLWRVQDKSGVILELGVVGGYDDSIEKDPTDASKVFRWNLKRQIDPRGNAIWYAYAHDGNRSYLTDIYDTFPSVDNADGFGVVMSEAAHHARLVYELRSDVSTSYRRGWQTTTNRRLVRVDVTAKQGGAESPRALARRYRLSYVAGSYVSLLQSVRVEGRCAPDLTEQQGVVPEVSCPSLPAMSLGYTHVSTDVDGQPIFDGGFEVIDTVVRSVANSPKHSINEDYTDIYDVNSDGLPDVVTMMPGLYDHEHALWLQGGSGIADSFANRQQMGLHAVLGANASVITKHNPNLVSFDLDGDATIDLLHMPKVKTYSVYTPLYDGGKWWWEGREITTADALDARIDFSGDAREIRVFDVNGDGLVDVVKTSGTALQVWFALGRYPGGEGRFGSATWNGPDTASLSMAPVLRCVPWSGTPIRFSDGDTKLGDMNGDGLTDIVRLRKGNIKYWPGRGDGSFGTGELPNDEPSGIGPRGCEGGGFGQNTYVGMEDAPHFSDPDGSGLRVEDVNGDGLADLVQLRLRDVDVWHNLSGQAWGERRWLRGTPVGSSYQNRVRIVDMNGSGTADILWGGGYDYKYIDLLAAKRPWLLNRVENGMGKTTEVEYATTTEQMLEAQAAGQPWNKVSPVVGHVVKRITVRDNLTAVGRPGGGYVTEYTYRDPVYDGVQREFRGFSETTVRSIGDNNSPTSKSHTTFLLGERPKQDAWKDNPNEALKGLPTVAETYDPATGTYPSTTATTYVLRKLFEGRDGRDVYVAFAKQTDAWLYDTADFSRSESDVSPSVDPALVAAGEQVVTSKVTIRAQTGTKHTRSAVVVDIWGNRTKAIAYGEVGEDETITTVTEAALSPTPMHVLGEGNWAFRTTKSWVEGTTAGRRNLAETVYDETYGDAVETRAYLQQSTPLYRKPGGAPAPNTPVNDTWITTQKKRYDSFGNPSFTWAAGGRCARVAYDGFYNQLPIEERVYVGQAGQQTVYTESFVCGDRPLVATAEYDHVLQAATRVTDVNAGVTRIDYDGFGRLTQMFAPSPRFPAQESPVPSLLVEYQLPDVTGRPVSLLISRTHDGADEAASNSYHESYAYIDGLGRTIATLSEADPEDDAFHWVVKGLTEYDAKGAAQKKYLAWTYDGNPTTFPLSAPSPAKYAQQRYDAFGRTVVTHGLDGNITLLTRYHALSADAWDAEDIDPGLHQGTYASEEKDGHGRVKRTTERVHNGGAIEERQVEMMYLPTGEPVSITRKKAGVSPYNRMMLYDSLGRMVYNQDPAFGAAGWRYLYGEAGELVATSDPRGCGVNFTYDHGGRLLREDYSPCEPHHAPYDAVPEILYEYDDPSADAPLAFKIPPQGAQDCRTTNFTNGRLVAVTDRAQKSITCYDGRGRTIEVAKQLANPSGVIDGRWYNRRAAYDGADRPVVESTGASTGPSQVRTSYTARGKVKNVDSSYGMLVEHVKRDADGLVQEIKYGDKASTTTGFTYDNLRRLQTVTTYRPDPGTWTDEQPMLLQDEEFKYDRVGNPVEIRDWRDPSEWPAGAKPVTRKMGYDDLYRLSRIDYQYSGGKDDWVDPYAAEVSDISRPQPTPRRKFAAGQRVQWQTYGYDWLGNTSVTADDQSAFYDRSLGTITNDGYKLSSASESSGKLSATYDTGGNTVSMDVSRSGPCTVPGKCANQHYEYEWDEVGRLVRARRDHDVELVYEYDASDQRVRKTTGSLHTLYIFSSLELRGAAYDGSDYELKEVPFLFAHGVRLARVVSQAEKTHVFLELGDHLGSTSVVLDRASGELVQRSTAYAYGEVESSLRPDKWDEFREDYRFTGKEDDVEVGLIYFGKRFYAPLLQRWVSPDPLAVHAPGQADLNLYAYVHGRVLVAVDPVGLQDRDNAATAGCQGAGGNPEAPSKVTTLNEIAIVVEVPPNRAVPAPGPRTGAQGSAGDGRVAVEPPTNDGLVKVTLDLLGAAAEGMERARNARPIQPGVGDRTGPLMIDVMGAASGSLFSRVATRVRVNGAASNLDRLGLAEGAVPGGGTAKHPKSPGRLEVRPLAAGAVSSVDDLSRAAAAADRGGLTAAGRALQKHGGRPSSAFPAARGNPAQINQAGQNIVDDILWAPGSTQTMRSTGRFGDVVEVTAPDGRGVRFSADGKFIGFLEPPR